ncbi:MAG: type IX secretion system protein PorQ [Bacteroidaceae bacterium]|nr:type IX secretion system protein PorQ [Bacteroidaceae bacterium]
MTVKRGIAFITSLLLSATTLLAQQNVTAYEFLRVPKSAHATALGGDNISTIEDDATLVHNNPALLASVSDKTLAVNVMTYFQGAVCGGASFAKIINDRASWGVTAQYVNYGKMKQTTAGGDIIGTFSANDVAIGGTFSYQLSKYFVGGITAKWIGSFIGSYSSMAIGVDLGLNYYHADYDLSVSAVAKNLGGQVKAFQDVYDKMPIDVQLGVTKGFGKLPFRLNVTLVDLNHWNYGFLNHFVFGADILLGSKFYIAGSYNCKRAYDMKIYTSDDGKGSSHGAGLSVGGGLLLDRFKLNVAWAKYHVSSSSLVFDLAYSF